MRERARLARPRTVCPDASRASRIAIRRAAAHLDARIAMRAHVTLRAATPARARATPRAGRRPSAMATFNAPAPAGATSARVAYGNASTRTLKLEARRATRATTLGGGRRRFVTRAMFEVRRARGANGRGDGEDFDASRARANGRGFDARWARD